jgi:hypothetical protein
MGWPPTTGKRTLLPRVNWGNGTAHASNFKRGELLEGNDDAHPATPRNNHTVPDGKFEVNYPHTTLLAYDGRRAVASGVRQQHADTGAIRPSQLSGGVLGKSGMAIGTVALTISGSNFDQSGRPLTRIFDSTSAASAGMIRPSLEAFSTSSPRLRSRRRMLVRCSGVAITIAAPPGRTALARNRAASSSMLSS